MQHTQQGVEIDRKDLRWQYDVGMLSMLHRLLPTVYQDDMDLDAERGLPLLKAWISRIYARSEGFDFEAALQ